MNPWGFVVMLLGLTIAWVGIRGTQDTLYADIFGHNYVPNSKSPTAGPAVPTKPGDTYFGSDHNLYTIGPDGKPHTGGWYGGMQ